MGRMFCVEGDTICDTWEKAVTTCYEKGRKVKTQYDIDPNTGFVHPPSLDCTMTMTILHPLDEPRCHICIPGGPAELGAYSAEVVDGSKDHWVKKRPSDKTWGYTYSGRLHRYGDRLNSATPEAVFDSPEAFDDPENPWVGLAFSREAVDHEGNPVKIFLDIKPLDQIQGIVDTIIKTPYTRRAVAITSFPPTDTLLDDPPCLRYLWFRGFNEGPNGELEIEMHSHWRSRDAYQAAFMNMFAMTDLMSKVIKNVQIGLNKNVENLIEKPCPVCLSLSLTNDVPLERQDASMIRCRNCGSNPYLVLPGSYIDTSDSFHIYGKDISEFENRVLTAIENRAPTDRWWDLEGKGLSHLLEEGVAKDAEMIKHRDDRNDISLNTKPSNSATYHTPLELHFGRRKVG